MEHPVVCGVLAGRMFHLLQQLELQQTFTGYMFRLDTLPEMFFCACRTIVKTDSEACPLA